MSKLICPVCSAPLLKGEKIYTCPDNHSFDISKYGYVNLLMSQQSSQKRHGDDKAMVQARRDFLCKGYYSCLCDELCKTVKSFVDENAVLIDVGCGEGYYLNEISKSSSYEIYGIDISKDALRYASRLIKNGEFCVASAYSLPFSENSADCILNIFAPSPYEEFSKVIKNDGVLIKAVPLEDHLWELKKAVYDEPYKNKPEKRNEELFSLEFFKEIKYIIDLKSTEDILNLFKMTPYYYKTGRKETERLQSLKSLSTTVHFGVEVYKKR